MRCRAQGNKPGIWASGYTPFAPHIAEGKKKEVDLYKLSCLG